MASKVSTYDAGSPSDPRSRANSDELLATGGTKQKPGSLVHDGSVIPMLTEQKSFRGLSASMTGSNFLIHHNE
jgi:hypothetical protein